MAKRRRRMNEQEMIGPEVSREGLAALLERYGLGPLETVESLDAATGTLLVNGDLAIRCSSQSSVLRKEVLIYRRLALLSAVPSPEVLAFDTRRDLLPYDVLMLRHVPGVVGSTIWATLDLVQREQISEELGRICGMIHGLHWSVYGGLLPEDAEALRSARWTDIVMQKVVRVYEQASQRGLLSRRVLDAFATTISDSDSIITTPEMPVLTHTDLGLWNVLLCQEGSRWRIAAVLGWEAALTADPAWEFAALWSVPVNAYPLPDFFMHGYKERHLPPMDLRIRQRLYRTIYHLEQALRLSARPNADAQIMGIHLTAIERLLTPH